MPYFTNRGITPLPAAGGTTPISVPVAFWYEADVGVTVDGSNNVTQWADQSGNAHHLTPPGGTALNAVKVASVKNSLPGIRFDISGTHGSVLTTTSTFSMSQPYTIVSAIMSQSTTPPLFSFICGSLIAGQLFARHDAVSGQIAMSSITPLGIGSGILSSTAYIIAGQFNGASSTINASSITSATGDAGSVAFTSTNFQIGADSDTVQFGGHMLEVFCFSGVSGTDYSDSVTYLTGKWGPF